MRNYLVIILIGSVFFSCDNPKPKLRISKKRLDEILIQANKTAVQKESTQIDEYVKNKNFHVITTGTGLRYQIYHKGNGNRATKGKKAIVNYTVSLLDGTLCYTTKKKGAEEFIIGKDNDVESGLQEGISYLSVGDKAIIIIPSYLAHGLTGDFNKIPIRSTIVYDIELVALK